MARYIDADYLSQELKYRIKYTPMYAYKLALKMVESSPSADVREILHAHYDENGDCSNCGCAMPTDDKRDFITEKEVMYCYYCGAKMDKERKK